MDPLEHIYNSKYAGLAVIFLLVSAKLTIWVAGHIWSLLHLPSQVCFFDPCHPVALRTLLSRTAVYSAFSPEFTCVWTSSVAVHFDMIE